MKAIIKEYLLSNLLWLVLGIVFTSNLFFNDGMLDPGFNFFELFLAVFSDAMFIGLAFFFDIMSRIFDICFGKPE